MISIAEKRMMSKKIVESAKFIKMPVSSQNLYFHLLVNADDDGVVEAFPVINLIRANEDDLRVLVSKGFVQVLNEDLVSFIVDWRIQNTLRADRKIDSIYKDLLLQINPDVELLEMKERSDTVGSRLTGRSADRPWTAQYSIEEDNTDKDNTAESSIADETIAAQLGSEILTKEEYLDLKDKYSEKILNQVLKKILDNGYTGCLNYQTVDQWCNERYQRTKSKDNFSRPNERKYDYDALEKILMNR